ncbi:hypothetical protein GCM10010269_26110 [Streptomyces humidus]|uniref:Uncharacterized protein n=1 Tax=Streptomyces humidus TaxID=52259 RepID=A0A918L386_9ACTN|nr:hypothetical protein GCM10010269_26110 [Streptomyces humidus]
MQTNEAVCAKGEKGHGLVTHPTQRAGGAATRAARPPFELGTGEQVYETTAGSADLDDVPALFSSPTAIPRRLET